jgi:hypothetical protein
MSFRAEPRRGEKSSVSQGNWVSTLRVSLDTSQKFKLVDA